ncbi:MAG: hypothetical protein PWR06_2387 [Thermoanaerobacteraceae bacterium]|jgi:hypothetical protein|uniref:DUF8180 domain-containing protein n=1 Tax=Biomaibacter acetigenes TaxID=2316383 RepID=A0A3G2R796_9FIRM|nr:hypothetical protein [Biomaibacter acetigenes]MDK2879671.1 hypothetical protein [Thermoanaerobacteraceae bacterium]RKL61777.1 hypothetical protein DXT63_14975 [Thermoanaerobacteraceae bacterium SP2]AYO31283.1 hypothetical protein D2962_12340 [Biomaibacter acetigenes]MDN5300991.1 hypothetical protein [Thermoanaerobacteraceae bacterium]MDN5312306.1 hypothetical protein [Thermoanaerobacteraceae bacterium]
MCDHNHPSASDPRQDKEIETLRILLAHWIEHNKSHEENFREWADKSEKLGKAKVSEMISKAADSLNAASGYLLEAKKYI